MSTPSAGSGQALQDLAATLTVDEGFLPIERALALPPPMAWEFHACLARLQGADAQVLALLADEGQAPSEIARRCERLREGLRQVEAGLPGRVLATVWVLTATRRRAAELEAGLLDFEDGHFLAKTLVGRGVLCLEDGGAGHAGRRPPVPSARELLEALGRGAPKVEQVERSLRRHDEDSRRARALLSRGQPLATYALIGANTFAFMLELMLADRLAGQPPLSALGAQQAALEGHRQALLLMGANRGDLVFTYGQAWRLLASCFLHADALHLGMNMMALFSLGSLLERMAGPWRFLLVYLASGLAGSLASAALFKGGGAISLGASGAILGVAGALMAPRFRRAKAFPRELASRVFESLSRPVALVFLLGLGLALFGTRFQFDNWSHAGGLAAGFLMSYAYPPLLVRRLNKTV